MNPAYQSPLAELRARWDENAANDPLRSTHPASGGDETAYAASGMALVHDHVLPELADREAGTVRVLDLGCGPGRLLLPLRTSGAEVHGVDISPRMIHLARMRVGDRDGIQLHVGDGMTLRCVRRHQFDVVLAIDVLRHVPTPRIANYLIRQAGYRLAAEGLLKLLQPTRDCGPEQLRALFAHTGLAVADTRIDPGDADSCWIWARRQTAGTETAPA